MATRSRQILDLDPSLVERLPGDCRSCCFWETGEACSPGSCPSRGTKESWVESCLEEGFCPGKLVVSEGVTVGYVQYSPAHMLPRLESMPYPRPSAGSVYITCLYVSPEFRGLGVGRLMLEVVQRQLCRKRCRTLETHGLPRGRAGPPGPAEFFMERGFRVVTGHREAPLMRMDLRSLVTVQQSIQALLEKLSLPSFGRRPAPRPDAPAREQGA